MRSGGGRGKGGQKGGAKNRFVVEGKAALLEYARHKPASILAVSATDEERGELQSQLAAAGLDLTIGSLPKAPKDHAGRWSPVKGEVRLSMQTEADLLSHIATKKPALVLALDHITDPRNLGAIMRSAAFYGISHVVVPERRQVLLTDASVSTAQGGFARTELVCVVNLGRTLMTLKDAGYWVLSAAMNGEPLEDLAGVYEHAVLVLGSEDKGISAGIEKKSDRLIGLTGAGGGAGGLDSLNVAVAAGILLHGLTRSPS